MLFHSHHSATIWPRPPLCRVWTRGRQLNPEPASVIYNSIAEGLCSQNKRGKKHNMKRKNPWAKEEKERKWREEKWEGSAQSKAHKLVHPLRHPMAQKSLGRPTQWMVAMYCRRPVCQTQPARGHHTGFICGGSLPLWVATGERSEINIETPFGAPLLILH